MSRTKQPLQLIWRQCHRRAFSQSQAKPLWGEPPVAEEGAPPQVELTVNGMAVRVPAGTSIMQACSVVGVDVPRFCYHERLKIAGNCRMCLVQVNGGPKLMASCAAPVGPKMVVETDSTPVKKAREGVMEFLLANHPLDCPICDQGGECDLQEQAMAFGTDRSRFLMEWGDEKRAVEDKEFGPLVKTSMNRCIHCTRCVRFANDVAGFDGLGTTGRGNEMQISTYVHAVSIASELSGNLVDLCPVGALTSKPYAFQARPWELKGTPSVDVMDGLGSAIRVDSRGPEVMRVLPRLNEAVNEEWLGDKSRFACDGLRNQRLVTPMIRRENGSLEECGWEEALLVAAEQLRGVTPEAIRVVAGPFADVETLVAMKDLAARLGITDLRLEHDESKAIVDVPAAYRFNAGIAGIEEADRILIVGSNPRKEAPVLNARIRKAYLAKPSLKIGYIGEDLTANGELLTYKTVPMGKRILEHDIAGLQAFFEGSERPMLIIGEAALTNSSHRHQLGQAVRMLGERLIRGKWNGFCALAATAGRTGAHEIGWTSVGESGAEPKVVYLLGADVPLQERPQFTIYQGHHGDIGAQSADLVLPGLAYTEKASMYVSTEGRPQRTTAAVGGPAGARADWQIVRALAEVSGVRLGFDDEAGLYRRIDEIAPGLLEHFGELPESSSMISSALLPKVLLNGPTTADTNGSSPLRSRITDYYLTDAISRASPTMARCSLVFNRAE